MQATTDEASEQADTKRKIRVVVAKPDTPLPPLGGVVLLEPDGRRHPLAGVVAALRFAARGRHSSVPPSESRSDERSRGRRNELDL